MSTKRRVLISLLFFTFIMAIISTLIFAKAYPFNTYTRFASTSTYPVIVEIEGVDYSTKATTLGYDADVARATGEAVFITDEPTLSGKVLPFELRDLVLYPDGRDVAISQRITGHLVTGDQDGDILMMFSGRAATGTLASFRTTGSYAHLSMAGEYTFIVIPIYDDGILIYKLVGTFEGTLISD